MAAALVTACVRVDSFGFGKERGSTRCAENSKAAKMARATCLGFCELVRTTRCRRLVASFSRLEQECPTS